MELIFGLAAIASGLWLAYMAGADDQDRRTWQAQQVADQYAAALGEAQQRHPAYREPPSNLDRLDGVR